MSRRLPPLSALRAFEAAARHLPAQGLAGEGEAPRILGAQGTRPDRAGLRQLDPEAEASMLAGYLSAAISTSKTIATFGGQPLAGVTRFMDGFVAGAN